LDNIFIWEEEVQRCFADSLYRATVKLANYIGNKKAAALVNVILKFYITTIATDESNIFQDYLASFDNAIAGFGAKIDINKDIIDYINSMGSFGRDNRSRRYSAYLCCCVFRVSGFY
jgi:hypothetical protein